MLVEQMLRDAVLIQIVKLDVNIVFAERWV